MPDQRPDLSGTDWLERMLKFDAEVSFNRTWIIFGIGRLGPVCQLAKDSPENAQVAFQMIASLHNDLADFEKAHREFAATIKDILANVARNLNEGQ